MPCYYDPFTGSIGCTGVTPPGSSGPSSCDGYSIPYPQQWFVGCGGSLPDTGGVFQAIELVANGGQLQPGSTVSGPYCTSADAQAWLTSNPNACQGKPNTTCWQLPDGTQIQLPPDAQPPAGAIPCPIVPTGGPGGPGVCPTCEQSPCNCARKCYQLPDGTYVWLGPNDQVPSSAVACDDLTTPVTPEQIGDEITPADAAEQEASTCITDLAWGSPDWCKCAELWRVRFADLGNRLAVAWGTDDYDVQGVLANVFAFVNALVPNAIHLGAIDTNSIRQWMKEYVSRTWKLLGDIYNGRSFELVGVSYTRAIVESLESLDVALACGDEANEAAGAGIHVVVASLNIGVVNSMSRHIGASMSFKLPEVKLVLDQLAMYFAPTRVLGVPDAIQLYQSGLTTLPQLQCMVACAGVHPDWAQPLALAARARPTPYEWIAAWRRGKINDNQLADALRSTGFTVAGEQDILVTVTNVLPPPSDLARFMLKSIGDPNVVQQFQLEAEFEQLYQGRIKQWAIADGVSEEVLRGYHAAHWDVPSPGDLSIFWQRYGTNRDSPQANALPSKFTSDNYDRALREQGIAPYWRPFYRAAQFGLLGQRQLQWGLQFGQMTLDVLKNAVLDTGLRPDLADVMVGVMVTRAVKAWSTDTVIKAYTKNGINEQGIRSYLKAQNVIDKITDAVIAQVRIEAIELANEQLVTLLEKQYETGGIDAIQLASALQQLGLDQDQLQRIVLSVKQKKEARPKAIPAVELCKWYGSRLISRQEFATRLVTLNYTPYDAELIVAKCESDLTIRQLKQEQLALKAQAAEQRKIMHELSYEERTAQLSAQRAARSLAAQIKAKRQVDAAIIREEKQAAIAAERVAAKKAALAEKAEREELTINALVSHVADVWSKKTGTDPVESAQSIVDLVQTATADGSVTVLEVLRAMASLVALPLTDLPDQLADLVAQSRQQVVAESAISSEPPTSANGQASPKGPE